MRTSVLVCLALLFVQSTGTAQNAPPSAATAAAATFVSTSAGAMFTVARLLTEDTWNPLFDKRIQEAPSARSLGAAWKPSDARWQKARAALGARAARLLAAYKGSTELQGHIETEVGRLGQSKDLDAAIAALKGPAGPAIVRQQAKMTYIVRALTAEGPRANGPEPGSAEWNKQLADSGKQFDDRAGTDVPADDGTHKADLEKILANRPVADVLRRVWDFGVSIATRQLKTGLNLMMFDDQAAIEKDIAAAIGRSGAVPAQGAAAPAGAGGFPLEQLATCQESWMDWKDDPVRAETRGDAFRALFQQKSGDVFFTPIGKISIMGLPVSRVYPSTVGMGVGFSLMVDAPFDKAKAGVEKSLGKTVKCQTGEGMRTCELAIAEKKTVMLLADATGKLTSTLIGCFYYYEK